MWAYLRFNWGAPLCKDREIKTERAKKVTFLWHGNLNWFALYPSWETTSYLKPCQQIVTIRRFQCATNAAHHGPLARYAKSRVAHASGVPGTFSSPPWVSDPDMHHGTCVTHVPWCVPGSLTSGFIWGRWRRKRSRHSQRMRNSQSYLPGKRPVSTVLKSTPKLV